MGYKIEVTAPAQSDIDSAVAYITQDSVDSAGKWLSGLESIIQSLNENPGRHSQLHDLPKLRNTYRHVVYFSHHVIYRIEESDQIVYIVRVYHGARKPLEHHDFAE